MWPFGASCKAGGLCAKLQNGRILSINNADHSSFENSEQPPEHLRTAIATQKHVRLHLSQKARQCALQCISHPCKHIQLKQGHQVLNRTCRACYCSELNSPTCCFSYDDGLETKAPCKLCGPPAASPLLHAAFHGSRLREIRCKCWTIPRHDEVAKAIARNTKEGERRQLASFPA